ncbi:MAG: hypothetical protein JNK10_02050 [Cyclobacteriaceae bacterium]|nr:hypothetical protein [Cyclobacteriaceae bacterium]
MRHVVLIICFFLTGAPPVLAQVKYKDLAPTLDGMGKEEMKDALKEYLIDDLDHPNANFRLALIYESNYRAADVLTRHEYLLANAEQARLRFTKARQLVDDREVNRNNEYYAPIFKTVDAKGRPSVEFSVVSGKITRGLDSATLFLTHVPPIYASFTRSVSHYDQAVKIFSEINSEFLSLDDLYLYHDAAFDKKLGLLKQNYDSAKFFFDRYVELTKAFPIPYHKQKYHIKPIVTYRLDGLITRMNFLTNDVELWDYSSWVDKVRKAVNDEILSLRSRLNQNEIKVSENLTKISASNGEGVAIIPIDKQVVFNLNNYDKQSLVLALLEYKAFKQDWILKTKTFVPDTTNLDRNATIYSTLIYSNKTADTLLSTVKTRATKDKIRKHNEFIAQHYGGPEGLQKFIEGERENIRITFEQYSGGLRSALLNMVTTPQVAGVEKLIRFGKWGIPSAVHAVTPEALAKGDPITLATRRSPDGSSYLAGIYRPDKKTNLTTTYVAKVNPDGKAGWMQSFNFKVDSTATTADAHSNLGPLEITQEGCVFVVRSTHLTQPLSKNTLVYLNEKGEAKFNVRLAERSVARKISFTERSNSLVLLFKGSTDMPDYTSMENLTLTGITALGDVLWRRQLVMAGGLTDFINLIDGHMLAGNYTILMDTKGKEHKAKPGESNPFMVRFNDKGDIEKVLPITTPKPVYINSLVKVTDRSINLIGKEGSMESQAGKPLSSNDEVAHIMSNRLCEIVCSNVIK